MKRLISAIVFMVLLLNAVTVINASVSEGVIGDNITWKIEGGVMIVSGTGVIGDNITWKLEDGVMSVSGTGAIPDIMPGKNNTDLFLDENGESVKGAKELVETLKKAETIEKLVIEDGITGIGQGAFRCANKIYEVVLPEGLTTIGAYAFYGTYVKKVSFPESLKYIGDYAFEDIQVDEIYIPKDVEHIGRDAFGISWFKGDSTPKAINVSDENGVYASLDGVLYSKDMTTLIMYPSGKEEKVFTIPETVKYVGDGETCVFDQVYFDELRVSEGVEYIRSGAFTAGRVDRFYLPASLKGIGSGYGVYMIRFTQYPSWPALYYPKSHADWEKLDYAISYKDNNIYYGEISVSLNGGYIEMDTYPKIENERTLVPMRAIFEALGASVTWDDDSKCATALKDGTELKITIGEAALYKNGARIELDAAAKIENERTLVPVRAIAEAFGASVTWDNDLRRVNISTEEIYGLNALSYYNTGTSIRIKSCDSAAVKVVIPNEIEGLPVKEIGSSAFKGCKELKTLVLPDGVTLIEARTFQNLTKLESVKFPKGVLSIGEQAFEGCVSLKEVEFDTPYIAFDKRAFAGCTSLERVNVPENTMLAIVDYTFSGCSALKEITIPQTVTQIFENAFENCTELESITLPESLNRIDHAAFSGCTALKSVIVPDEVNDMRESVFRGCTALESVVIGNGVQKLKGSTFSGCTALKEVTIGKSVSALNVNEFEGCGALERIEVDGENAAFCDIDGVLYSKDKTKLIFYPKGRKSKEYLIPDGVTEIGENAFSDCGALTYINIPQSVTEIGEKAFSGCSGLKSLDIPQNAAVIGSGAFSKCAALEGVVIRGEEIGESMF